MKFVSKSLYGGLLLTAVVLISGCGGGPKLHKVSGTLTHDGKPLPNMNVIFAPVADVKGSSGMTDADGKFTLKYSMDQEGVPAGEHVVYVDYMPDDADLLVAFQAGEFEKLACRRSTCGQKVLGPRKVDLQSNDRFRCFRFRNQIGLITKTANHISMPASFISKRAFFVQAERLLFTQRKAFQSLTHLDGLMEFPIIFRHKRHQELWQA